jgi:WD40 repeat protein
VNSVCADQKNGLVISASSDKSIRLWSFETGQAMGVLHTDGSVYDCDMSPKDNHVIAAGEKGLYWLSITVI